MGSNRSGPYRAITPVGLPPHRLSLVQFFFFSVLGMVGFQALQLSLFHQPSLVERAQSQHRLVVEIPQLRGAIRDRHGQEFAVNLRVPSVYAVPRLLSLEEKEFLAENLARLLDLSPSFVRGRLDRNKAFIWIKRRISTEEAEKIESLAHPAVGILHEYKRFYPHGTLLANVLGFANVDNEGLEGIERVRDRELRGKPGRRISRRDALGREIKAFEERLIPAHDGHNVVLTIDRYLQYVTERALERAYRKWKAQGATAILMNPHNGEVLAMATRPTFDPNLPGEFSFENYRNRAITDMFEPGSVFKIVTAAGVLSDGKVSMTEKIDCEQGEWRYGRKTIHDVHGYGLLSFPEIIIKSSNIGTTKLGLRLGPEGLYRYVREFGFAEKTGIDLEGEVPGFIRPPREWSKTSPYAIPFGQEVTVTALQLVRAISMIANGGYLVEPHMIQRIEDVHGVTLQSHTPSREGPRLEAPVVEVLKEILWRVTEQGTGKSARVKGVTVAGKTGTAQKILEDRLGYSHSNFIASFIGFAPADHPLLSMVVVVDDPHPLYYGGTVAAPVFSEAMEAALAHLGYVP